MIKSLAVMFLGVCSLTVQAGILDPDCTAEKAAKSAAMKATIGVGGRCSPKEAVSDSLGLEDKKDAVSDAKENLGDRLDDADHLGRKAVNKAVND